MSTKINSISGLNVGNSTMVDLPHNTDITVEASAQGASKQGIFFQFEFTPAPANFGYEGNNTSNPLIPQTSFKTGPKGGLIQVYLWAVDGVTGYNGGSKVRVTKNANSIEISTEDAADDYFNDSILVFYW